MLGKCRHCGYYPVAENAPICPQCGGEDPNPGAFEQGCSCLFVIAIFVGIIMLISLTSGAGRICKIDETNKKTDSPATSIELTELCEI